MSKRFHGEAFVTAGGKAQSQQQATGDSDSDTTTTTTTTTTVEARPIRQPRRLKRLLGTMKRQIFGPSYDPYQRDQVAKEQQEQGGAVVVGATNQQEQEQEEARDERPTKRRRSLTSLVVNTISTMAYELFWNTTTTTAAAAQRPPAAVTSFNEKQQQQHHHSRRRPLFRGRDIDFTHFKTSSAWENRMQQAERFIRGVCLQSQQQQREQYQDCINDPSEWGLPPYAAQAYRLAVEEDNSKWGLVNKEDLDVCFLAPMPPPKPKRTYITIREVPSPPGVPVGVPHYYQHPRTYHHLHH